MASARARIEGPLSRSVREALESIAAPENAERVFRMALVAASRESVPEDPGPFASFVEGPLRTAVVQTLGLTSYDVVAERLAHVLHMATSLIRGRDDFTRSSAVPAVLDTEPWVEEDSRVRLATPPGAVKNSRADASDADAKGGMIDIPPELEALWESPAGEFTLPTREDARGSGDDGAGRSGADADLDRAVERIARDLGREAPPDSERRRLGRIDSSGSHPRPAFLGAGSRKAASYREIDGTSARRQSRDSSVTPAEPQPAQRQAGLPSSGLPSSGLPSSGLPSSGLPSSGLPSSILACTLDIALIDELRRRISSLGGASGAEAEPQVDVLHVGTVGDLLARLGRSATTVVLIDVALPSIDAPTIAQLSGSFPPGVRVVVWGMTPSQLQRFAVVFPVASTWIAGGLAGSPLDALMTTG